MNMILQQKKKKENKLLQLLAFSQKTITVRVLDPADDGTWVTIKVQSRATDTFKQLWNRFGSSKHYYCANRFLFDPYWYPLCWNSIHTRIHLASFGDNKAWLDEKTGCIHVEYADDNYDGNMKDWIKRHVRVCPHNEHVGPIQEDAIIYGGNGSFIHIPGKFRRCLDCGMPLDPDTCKDIPISFDFPKMKRQTDGESQHGQ